MEQVDKNKQMFYYLVSTFEIAALQQMGKIKNPLTDSIDRNLDQAQFSIDIIDMLAAKTGENLDSEEKRFIDNVLAQLKLNFIDELEKDKKTEEVKQEKETGEKEK